MKIAAQAMTPVPFVVFNGTSTHLVKPTKQTSFHLMVMLRTPTPQSDPVRGVWATIRQKGKVVYDAAQ